MHVHIATPDGVAKFWLEPNVALATFHNLSSKDLRKIEVIVKDHQDEYKSAWRRHFSQ